MSGHRVGILNDVLIIVGEAKLGYVKALLAKQPGVRSGLKYEQCS
jgi:hypothetical protein